MTGKDERRFMERAIRLAEDNASSGRGGPFGCVIVKDGTVVAEGVNLVTSTNDPTAHAEIVAIREACRTLGTFRLDDCEVYASCEPCPMCMGAIFWARPARLLFAASQNDARDAGFDDLLFSEEMARPESERSLRTLRMMGKEGQRPFKAWKENTRKVTY